MHYSVECLLHIELLSGCDLMFRTKKTHFTLINGKGSVYFEVECILLVYTTWKPESSMTK